MHLLLSVPRVEGADLRPWVPREHSLVISSARNPARSGGPEGPGESHDGSNVLDWDSASFLTLDMETAKQMSVIKLKVSVRCRDGLGIFCVEGMLTRLLQLDNEAQAGPVSQARGLGAGCTRRHIPASHWIGKQACGLCRYACSVQQFRQR